MPSDRSQTQPLQLSSSRFQFKFHGGDKPSKAVELKSSWSVLIHHDHAATPRSCLCQLNLVTSRWMFDESRPKYLRIYSATSTVLSRDEREDSAGIGSSLAFKITCGKISGISISSLFRLAPNSSDLRWAQERCCHARREIFAIGREWKKLLRNKAERWSDNELFAIHFLPISHLMLAIYHHLSLVSA